MGLKIIITGRKLANKKQIIIGISGASGAIYGIRTLEMLRDTDIETHLIITKAAQITIAQETDYNLSTVKELADYNHNVADIGANIASGSFKTIGMIITPCSIRTMSSIACGITSDVMTRAADVTLKEGRKLVLALRETPLHFGHLTNMTTLVQSGAIIAPPVPAFYTNPQSIDDIVNQSVGRMLDLFGIDSDIKRWKE
jgi:4-hydroxy-3-polyprenylbenzoate decarboxylase